jgi:hypothetical protein
MSSGFDIGELKILEEVVQEYLTELSMEIADTESFEFRERLKGKAEVLQAILAKLKRSLVVAVN